MQAAPAASSAAAPPALPARDSPRVAASSSSFGADFGSGDVASSSGGQVATTSPSSLPALPADRPPSGVSSALTTTTATTSGEEALNGFEGEMAPRLIPHMLLLSGRLPTSRRRIIIVRFV